MDMYHLIISCAAMAFQSYARHPTPPPKKGKKDLWCLLVKPFMGAKIKMLHCYFYCVKVVIHVVSNCMIVKKKSMVN